MLTDAKLASPLHQVRLSSLILQRRNLKRPNVSDSDRSPLCWCSGISLCAHPEMQRHQFLTGGHLQWGTSWLDFCFRFLGERILGWQRQTNFHASSGDTCLNLDEFVEFLLSRDAFVETSFSEEQALIRWGLNFFYVADFCRKETFASHASTVWGTPWTELFDFGVIQLCMNIQ